MHYCITEIFNGLSCSELGKSNMRADKNITFNNITNDFMADKRINRVFKTERRDIKHPVWRKKVDASIFYDKAILIPKFAEQWWGIPRKFKGITSQGNPQSKVIIDFDGESFDGRVTDLNAKKRTGSYRLWVPDELSDKLKKCFLMTFMRDLEFKLGDYNKKKSSRISIEDIIPFNEFLDIEFDKKKKRFIFTAHYIQQPVFNNLFAKILESTILTSISLQLNKKSTSTIVKSKWYDKAQLTRMPDQPNVIYRLMDDINEQFYVGEAKSLKNRLSQKRPEIPKWTHFRYDVLPAILEPYRVDIERMVIRDFASILSSKKKTIKSKLISRYTLKNKKIDT